MKKVLIFGASSYVGQHLVESLIIKNYKIFAYARENTQLFLICNNLKNITIISEKDIDSLAQIDYIINLGFVKNYFSIKDSLKRTKQFIDGIVEIGNNLHPSLLIHISSMAVFGENDEYRRSRQNNYVGEAYADSKISAENIIFNNYRFPFSIVRLGNVMGEFAPNWTGSIIQKILNLETLTRNGWGYSNVTYVHNIVDFIVTLIEYNQDLKEKFYHLAEFSNITWDKWIKPMAENLGISFSYLYANGQKPSFENANTLKLLLSNKFKDMIKTLGKRAMDNKLLSKKITFLKEKMPYNIKLENLPSKKEDNNLQKIFSSIQEFRTFTTPNWTPPIPFEEALNNILNLMF